MRDNSSTEEEDPARGRSPFEFVVAGVIGVSVAVECHSIYFIECLSECDTVVNSTTAVRQDTTRRLDVRWRRVSEESHESGASKHDIGSSECCRVAKRSHQRLIELSHLLGGLLRSWYEKLL